VRIHDLLLLGALMAGQAHPAWGQRAGAPESGVDGLVRFRGEGSVALLASATSYWGPVSTRAEELLGDFRYLPEYARARAQGQRFEVLVSSPPEWMEAEGEGGSGVGSFLAVPWSFGPGCAEEGWQDPEWVTPGDTVAFLLTPTRVRSREEGAVPVFDVLGWHQPYPVAELIPFWRKGPEANPLWLTPREFYELLSILPTERALRANPGVALEPALEWIEAELHRRSAFPVPELLAEWGQAAGAPGLPDDVGPGDPS